MRLCLGSLSYGLTVPEVALISGHRDPRMLSRYTHLRPEKVAEKLAKVKANGLQGVISSCVTNTLNPLRCSRAATEGAPFIAGGRIHTIP